MQHNVMQEDILVKNLTLNGDEPLLKTNTPLQPKENLPGHHSFLYVNHIKHILDAYLDAFKQLTPDRALWLQIGDIIFYKSHDSAAVRFELGNVFGEKEQIKKQGALGKLIAQQILDGFAYFSASNKSKEEVPTKLRICLFICHNNIHWTSLVINIHQFDTFYQNIRDEYRNNGLTIPAHINDIKNSVIADIFKLNLAKYLEKDILTKMIPHFEKLISIQHFDSYHAKKFFENVELSLATFKEMLGCEIENIPCGFQGMNKCGDHTAINLVMAGLIGCVPAINNAKLTTHHLRDFTMIAIDDTLSNETKRIEACKIIRRAYQNQLAIPAAHKSIQIHDNLKTLQSMIMLDIENLFRHHPHDALKLIQSYAIHLESNHLEQVDAEVINILDRLKSIYNYTCGETTTVQYQEIYFGELAAIGEKARVFLHDEISLLEEDELFKNAEDIDQQIMEYSVFIQKMGKEPTVLCALAYEWLRFIYHDEYMTSQSTASQMMSLGGRFTTFKHVKIPSNIKALRDTLIKAGYNNTELDISYDNLDQAKAILELLVKESKKIIWKGSTPSIQKIIDMLSAIDIDILFKDPTYAEKQLKELLTFVLSRKNIEAKDLYIKKCHIGVGPYSSAILSEVKEKNIKRNQGKSIKGPRREK